MLRVVNDVVTWPYDWKQDEALKNITFPVNPTEEQLEALGIFQEVSVPRPEADFTWEEQPTLVDGVWTQRWGSRDRTVAEEQEYLDGQKYSKREYVNHLRNSHEDKGIEVGGVDVCTTRKNRLALVEAREAMLLSSDFTTFNWQLKNGTYLAVSQETIQSWLVAIENHVQECWTRAMVLISAINGALSLTALNDIDITEGWPE